MAKSITLPYNLIKEKKLVILPRREYEDFLNWKKSIKSFSLTKAQKKELEEARKDFAQGKYVELEHLK